VLKQKLLILYAANSSLDSLVGAWSLFDGTGREKHMAGDGDKPPYASVVAAMRDGASDYLLKNNLARLAPAVRNAIQANRNHQARVLADSELAASRQRLAELAQHLQTSIELERAAIAREIHDDVGGSLTAVKYDLAWIARHTITPEVQHRVATAIETLDHAIGASQRIMHNLRPAILEQGLVPALQWMTSRFERRTGITCEFRSRHEHLSLPTGVPLVAYRFAQEALTNVARHARATEVRVAMSVKGNRLIVSAWDNGVGISADRLQSGKSLGILGIKERARTLGGGADVFSPAEGGTVVEIKVPVQQYRGTGERA